MPDTQQGSHGSSSSGGAGMIPPRGFKAEMYPLRHRFTYSAGLSVASATVNSTMLTLVKNYKGCNNPDTIEVSPHNPTFAIETGALCNPMSIIDKLKLSIKFNMTSLCNDLAHTSGQSGSEIFAGDGIKMIKLLWRPIFLSFPEKLDSVDERSTSTGAEILELTKDATQEDITPTFVNAAELPSGASAQDHPVSTVNFTEVFGTLNLDTDLTMEAVAWDEVEFAKAMQYYTNKGAIRSMVGRTRHVTLTRDRPHKSFFIDKFVPSVVRRIMPYSWFGILVHVPIHSEPTQAYLNNAPTVVQPHVGVKAVISYNEWHPDHNQEMDNP